MSEARKPQWRVWCAERGEARSDARVLVHQGCYSHVEAAEYWASHMAGFDGDPFAIIVCEVERHFGGGWIEPQTVEVTVRAEPVFEGRLKR